MIRRWRPQPLLWVVLAVAAVEGAIGYFVITTMLGR